MEVGLVNTRLNDTTNDTSSPDHESTSYVLGPPRTTTYPV